MTYPLDHIRNIANASAKFRHEEAFGLQVSTLTVEDQFNLKTSTSSKNSLVGERRIGDARSWVIPLRTAGIKPSPFPSYLVNYAGFAIMKLRHPDPSTNTDTFVHYNIKIGRLKEHSLRYEYILPSIQKEHRHFEHHTVISLNLLEPSQLPPNFSLAQIFGHGNVARSPKLDGIKDWVPPPDSGWRYYDDEMLEVLKSRYPDLADELKK